MQKQSNIYQEPKKQFNIYQEPIYIYQKQEIDF